MRLIILLLLLGIDGTCGALFTIFAPSALNIMAIGLAATALSFALLYVYLLLFGAEYTPSALET